MYYEAIDYWNFPDSYLEHHGVKGMKWGVRKKTYDVDVGIAKNKQTRKVAEDFHSLSDSQFKSRYQTSKKRFAKRYNKTNGDTYSLGKKREARAKNFLRREAGPSFGGSPDPMSKAGLLIKREATKAASEHYQKRSREALTNFGKAYNSSKSKNYMELSKHYNRQSKKSLGDRAIASLVYNSDYVHTPYHRMSGRTTTAGKECVNRLLLGIPGAVGDIRYMRSKRKQ